MNRLIISVLLFVFFALTGTFAQSTAAAEVSFVFTKQSGIASNQFAVWVEDNHGRHVKTLYATRYTANGGWKRRNTSIPQWVQQSGLAEMSQSQIDTLSGATPGTGIQTYHWDGTDNRNTTMPPGEYVIFIEANLRWANRVLYRAPIMLGHGAAAVQVTNEYFGKTGREQNIISSVTVKTLR